MAPPTNRDSDKFIIRLPDGMRDRIKAAAEANNRSMNAEIVARLERSLNGGVGGDLTDAKMFIAEVLHGLFEVTPDASIGELVKNLPPRGSDRAEFEAHDVTKRRSDG